MKKVLSCMLALCLLLTLLPTVALAEDAVTPDYSWYQDSAKDEDGCYVISTAAQLLGLANLVNGTDGKTATNFSGKTIKLTADIDLSAIANWTPIGFRKGSIFQGSFDGDGHKISGLYVNRTEGETADRCGLFGSVRAKDASIVIKDLTVSGSVTGKSMVGGVVGYCYGDSNYTCTVSNCHFIGNVTGKDTVGGVIGKCDIYNGDNNLAITVENCTHSGGTVTGNFSVGGVVGYCTNEDASGTIKITGCANSGAVSGAGTISEYVGGVVGNLVTSEGGGTTVESCVNSGTVTGSEYVGGVVGRCKAGSSGSKVTVASCLNTGTVSRKAGSEKITFGAVTGEREVQSGTITVKDCYYLSGCIAADAGFTGDPATGLTALAHEITTTLAEVYDEDELRAAVAIGAKTIKLMRDIECENTLICKDVELTLDLNGHVLSFVEGKKLQLEETTAAPNTTVTLIDSDPTATHTDTTLPKGGVVDGDVLLTRGGDKVENPVTLHADGGTVTGTVTLCSTAKIDCTSNTPTVFTGNVADGYDITCTGKISGGIFYGTISNTTTIESSASSITFMNDGTRYAFAVVESGAKAVAPTEPTRDGYAFDGWYTAASGGTKFDFANTTITDSIILYAKWVKDINTLEITLSIDDIPREWSSNATVPYDGQEHTVAITIRDGDTTLTEGTDYTVTGSTTETNAGNFDLSIKGIGNYAGSKDGGWQITAAPVTVKADDITVYVDDDMPTLTYTVTGLVEGEDLGDAVTLSCGTSDTSTAGSYTITPSGAAVVGNYTVTYESGTLTVAERSDGLAWLLPVLAALDKEPFDDVKSGDWFYDDVNYVYEYGLMTGTADRIFNSDAPVTRGMVMTILARREGIMTDRYSPWYAAGVEWAVVNGISDGTNPEAEITREELATMLYRYAKLRGYDLSDTFLAGYADAGSVSGYAVSAMQWAVHSGLINGAAGVNAGKLLPQSTATRAQLAAILHRFFG